MKRFDLLGKLLCLMAVLLSPTAWAYSINKNAAGLPVTWDAGSVNVKLQLSGSSVLWDGTTYNSSVQAAIQSWNAMISTLQIAEQVVASAAPVDNNSVNEIGFDSGIYGSAFGYNVLAVTVSYSSTTPRPDGSSRRTQSDIIFNSAYTWNSYRGGEQGPIDIRRVALHELGHLLGLGHPDQASPAQSVVALMNSYISDLDTITSDDITGAQTLYGATSYSSLPTFYSHPGNENILEGQPAWFYAAATGHPAPSYQWQRLAADGGSWLNVNDDGTYSGATSPTLYIPVVSAGLNGRQFRCVATNSAGTVSSSSATLTVILASPPVVSNNPSNQTAIQGGSAGFYTFVSGTSPLSYRWQRLAVGGSTWLDLSDSSIFSGTGTYYLTLNTVGLAMSGDQFRCVVTNIAGSATTSAAVLTVTPATPPSISNVPSQLTVNYGESITINPSVAGSWPIVHEWRKNGVVIPGAVSSYFYKSNVTESDSGSYVLSVSNAAGSANSPVITVMVNPPAAPVISNLPTEVVLSISSTLSLSPTVTGTQPITFQWKKNGVNIPGANQSYYSKSNVTVADDGEYTLAATNLFGAASHNVTVAARVPHNIVRLLADPMRSKIYALEQNGTFSGSVLVVDPNTALPTGSISVGQKPTDLSISPDGNELLVICAASQNVSVINLNTLQVTGTIALPAFGQWDVNYTSAHIKHGPGNIVYYSDGTWAPVLHVLDRSSGAVLQSILLDGNGSRNDGTFGFGDFVLTPDHTQLFAWGQYGWSAGLASSAVAKFTVNPSGTLTFGQKTDLPYPSFQRDPLNTPALVTADGENVFLKQYRFSTESVTSPVQSFSAPVYSIAPGGEMAVTNTGIHTTSNGDMVYALNPGGTVQAITADYSRLVYFDAVERQLRTVNLMQVVGSDGLGLRLSPADGAFVLPPTQLTWMPQAGVFRYRVYLGSSFAAVNAATTGSPEYLGEGSGTSHVLPSPLAPGGTYYWRVDAISADGVIMGSVRQFTTASITTSSPSIDVTTVLGDRSQNIGIVLGSASPGRSWSAETSAPWLSFENTSGTTPATLIVKFDASVGAPGLNKATIEITSDDGTFSLPVHLTIDPLALTVMRSARNSTKVYAISEVAAAEFTGYSRAYLLEIDALFGRIDRAVRVGTGVTDFALHEVDGRLYVTNWKKGALLAVDRATFTIARSYAFPYGISDGTDAYRVAAGTAGRVIVEPENQWIRIALFDTVAGTRLSTTFERAGSGASEPSGRFYYHGDYDSGVALHKFDTLGDQFSEVTEVRPGSVTSYNRTVVVTEDGERIFWNGVVFTKNLETEWSTGATIYSASADGRYAFGETKIYDLLRKQLVGDMPASTKVSAFNSTSGQLVYQNGLELGFYGLPGAEVAGTSRVPKNGSIVSPTSVLEWTALAGASGYRVYVGLSESAVALATMASPEYMGQPAGASLTLGSALVPGNIYYWRVDIIVGGELATGKVQSFTVSEIVPSLTAIDAATVKGHRNYLQELELTSATPGKAWTATANADWIHFQSASGTTPALVNVVIDTTSIPMGENKAVITIAGQNGDFDIPVRILIDPLAVTMMRSVPQSAKVYAISEEGAANYSGLSRAYLLEIDTRFKRIDRVVPVGTGVSDFAVHEGDDRVYVTNWGIGTILAVDRELFSVIKTYAVALLGGSTSQKPTDAYRIAAGGPGRLVVEEMDQWISIGLLDTTQSTWLAGSYQREGAGTFDPSGRYYFHCDNNSSNALLRKFDTSGDGFVEVGNARPAGLLNYYGTRHVIMSERGNRVFWNGVVFGADLVPEWTTGEIIRSVSADGRYAFGAATVYDVSQKKTFASLPISTGVQAFSSVTGELVFQNGPGLQYYRLPGLVAPVNDFNGDGKSDILWHDRSSGERKISLMNGGVITSSASLNTITADWNVAAIDDFNGDGCPDLLWQNVVTGQRGFWIMNETSLDGGFVALATVPVEWSIVAAGDFNTDGHSDLVWQNDVTGERGFWLMNGTQWTGTFVPLATVPLEWNIAAAGDFNGDGKADLVWQNRQTGQRSIWLMNRTVFGSGAELGFIGVEWRISGTGDFNQDGHLDLVWENRITGARGFWLMNGTQLQGGFVELASALPIQWAIGGSGQSMAAPTILVQPQGGSIIAGGTIELNVTAAGMAPISYQWLRNGEPIVGAIGPAYSISSAEWPNAGTYTVTLSNLQGLATSAPAVVVVHPRISTDFNSDANADLIWQNEHTGQRVLWLMSGVSQLGASIDLGTIGPDWSIAATADFNGDEQPDIVWQNTVTGQRGFWLMNGTSTHSDFVPLATVAADWNIAGAGDFNGDGQADLVWENRSTGERSLWLLNGTAQGGFASLGTVSTDWAIAAAGDFNGDGKPDLVWQNTTTGQRSVWLMNGTTFESGAELGFIETEWRIVRGADYNGDQQTDLLWENTTTGQRGFWLMNGTVVQGDFVNLSTRPLEWTLGGYTHQVQLPALSDFNQDGRPDLIWQNVLTGQRVVWLMNGTTQQGAYVDLGTIPVDWQIAAAADFNGDGDTDLVWQNTISGQRGFWLMNGTSLASEFIPLITVSPEWKIAAAGDYDGDGKYDLVLENSNTGQRGFWLLNGTSLKSNFIPLITVSPDWHIAASSDFDGNGKPDLVLENTASGERGFWLLNGTQLASDFVPLATIQVEWRIARAGDFNGDSKADLVWQNTVTGQRGFWLMDGTRLQGSFVDLALLGTEWNLAQ